MKRPHSALGLFVFILSAAATGALGETFSSEFVSNPVSEGWSLVFKYCEPQTWNYDGWYNQELDLEACPPGPGGGRDVYRRSLQSFNGFEHFFLEFHLRTDGDQSEIPGGGPTVMSLSNNAGVLYHITVARDLVQFFRDADLPILFTKVEDATPHTYRIEIYPDGYLFSIDGFLIDMGVSEGSFPAFDSQIAWQGRSWYLPCENAWNYIRYGRTPPDASGDFDSDGVIAQDDFYFFYECLTNDRLGINGGPDNIAGPGCRFADFDADGDVDLLDLAEFQNLFDSSQP